jgi:hypothetical protein
MSSKEENDKEKESNNNIDKTLENNNKENNDVDNLLNKKTKREADSIEDEEISDDKNKQKKLEEENEPKKLIEYEYGYIIQFLENDEKGLMEDFLPKISESSDYFNYGLTKEEFDKRVHDSLLYHYEQKNFSYIFLQREKLNVHIIHAHQGHKKYYNFLSHLYWFQSNKNLDLFSYGN